MKSHYLTLFLTLGSLTSSCTDSEISADKSRRIKDTQIINSSRYQEMLTAYQDDIITNDSILLGFRIGMSQTDMKDHLKELIKSGKIIRSENSLFAFLATNEYEPNDKDSVHQFLLRLELGMDKSMTKLKGIQVRIYAPRFLVMPDDQKSNIENNPAYLEYKKIVGDSMANSVAQNSKSLSINRIKWTIDENLIMLLREKYGRENHIISDDPTETTHIWISPGKIVELFVTNNYNDVFTSLSNRKHKVSKGSFSELVLIGGMSYYSIQDKIHFHESMNNALDKFQQQADSISKAQKEKEENHLKERVRNSGI